MKALVRLFRTTAFKLSLAYLVLFGIGAALVLTRVQINVEDLFDEQTAQTIDADIRGLAEQYSEGGIRQLVEVIERRVRTPGASLYLVTTFSGELVVGNIAELPPDLPDGTELVEARYQRRGETAAHHRAMMRLFQLPGGFRLLVGHDLQDRKLLRGILRRALVASLFWLIAIGTLGGLIVARRILARLDKLSASGRRIMSGDLEQRLPLMGADDELDRLAGNLNAMLDRIGQLMTGLREVSDNIAHDLKTPLTRLRNRADAALRADLGADQYRDALTDMIEESDALIRIFDALLMIARAEAGYCSDFSSDFDAGRVAADIAEMYEPVAEEHGARIELAAAEGLTLRGNRELLGQALVNLVDNALKYGATEPGAVVGVAARGTSDGIEIAVSDRGPGIAEKDRDRVIGRFVRLENSRSRPGSGLGLSLAAAVARLHGGTLRIEDNAPGLRVVLALPRAAQAKTHAPSTAPSPAVPLAPPAE
ncbi:sensor histidine kinase [Methylosinus sp. LW4]|uniref:sensor histidine kinase n=1 Tax=Methylosinus sp. LW4 TaxID=136993 RepID=UPI00035F6405|nr:ATP-binding protein [Methylosinus sp. LW4]